MREIFQWNDGGNTLLGWLIDSIVRRRDTKRVEHHASNELYASKFLIKNEINFQKLFPPQKHLNISLISPFSLDEWKNIFRHISTKLGTLWREVVVFSSGRKYYEIILREFSLREKIDENSPTFSTLKYFCNPSSFNACFHSEILKRAYTKYFNYPVY